MKNRDKVLHIPYSIQAFDKKTEWLAFTITLAESDGKTMEKIFGYPLEEMQTDGFDINAEQAEELNKAFNLNIDISKFDYQLDCNKRKNGWKTTLEGYQERCAYLEEQISALKSGKK